jgi:[ribosomal protein S5]-alanine N-acetyltransferase
MELIPIYDNLEANQAFANNPLYKETIQAMIGFYQKVGFHPPWIGYYVKRDNHIVGSAGFKGPPIHGRVEIAYGTMDEYQHQGIGTAICKELVDLSLRTDPSIIITARTFSENNYSTRVLINNNFVCQGTVQDPEDGEVWEWVRSLD